MSGPGRPREQRSARKAGAPSVRKPWVSLRSNSMLRKFLLCCALSSLLGSATATADTRASPGSLSAAQIIERNVAARGGLSAWRAVQTMTYKGKLEAGGKQSVQLPFVMEMKRPCKTRVELEFANEKGVQVYDGQHG